MGILTDHAGLYTDFYELTMAQGYFLSGRHSEPACFDYFFRKAPFQGSYVVFAGLGTLLDALRHLTFDEQDCEFLAGYGFDKRFLQYLKEFRFKGCIYAPAEGEIVFPNEPLIRVEGTLLETQIIETLLLNQINFQSLIATKASRLRHAAGDKIVVDFGLRRAQGLGGIHASRAAIIGGCNATSNVFSAFYFDLTATGTMAHSWVQSFESELEAFRAFARLYPDNCVLLVDTYDTLASGIPNAITVARELQQQGKQLKGIRLDSGDLAYLAKKARQMLDDAGLTETKIVVSNKLDEYVIKSLIDDDAPVDVFGAGTFLITGNPDAALDGIYKLSMAGGQPRLKISENIEKINLPGVKKVFRYLDENGMFYADGVCLVEEGVVDRIYHPFQPVKSSKVEHLSREILLNKVMENGSCLMDAKPVEEIRSYAMERLSLLPNEHKRFINPHIYKVGVSRKLLELRDQLIRSLNPHFKMNEP